MDFDDRPDPAKRLEEARVARKFKTMKDACRYFRWKYETYQQHEKGHRGIGRAADKYARAFRVSTGWLLTGEGRGPNDPEPDKRSVDQMLEGAEPDVRDAVIDFVERLTKKAS